MSVIAFVNAVSLPSKRQLPNLESIFKTAFSNSVTLFSIAEQKARKAI
jgi:hypothetical protein